MVLVVHPLAILGRGGIHGILESFGSAGSCLSVSDIGVLAIVVLPVAMRSLMVLFLKVDVRYMTSIQWRSEWDMGGFR